MTPRSIDVLFCADPPYFQHMAATITSLLRANPDHMFRLFICSAERDERTEQKIGIVASQFGNASAHFLQFDVARQHAYLTPDRYLTIATYLRLFATEYIDPQVSKLLYLDCDTIVCADIGALWRTDLGQSLLAAVPEPYITDRPGFARDDTYFSAGVLLFDVQRWRDADVVSQFVRFAQDHAALLINSDQDILNHVFKGAIASLPYRWNFQASFADLPAAALNMSDDEFRDLRRCPGIVHYTGRYKPWCYQHQPHYKRLYWDALASTPWRTCLPADRTRRAMVIKAVTGISARERLNWYVPRLADGLRRVIGKRTRLHIDPTAR